MSIWLPARPFPASCRLIPIDPAGELTSPLGGPTIRINRLGDRFALLLEFQQMEYQGCGSKWASRIDQARKQGALAYLPKTLRVKGDARPAPAAVVDGAGQAGMALKIRALPANFAFAEYQPLSVIQNGRRYLYLSAAPVVASGAGVATIPLTTMLRAPLSDGAVVEIDLPVIEGIIPKDQQGPGVLKSGISGFDSLMITEN